MKTTTREQILNCSDFNQLLNAEYGERGTQTREQFEAEAEAFVLGEILRQERKSAGLTQQQLAEQSGYNKTTISRLEKGSSKVSLSSIFHIFAGMGRKVAISVLSLTLLLTLGVGQMWAWNNVYYQGDNTSWNNVDMGNSGDASIYMYIANGQYWRYYINGCQCGPTSNSDFGIGSGDSKWYRYDNCADRACGHYTGYSGIVLFHGKQDGNGDYSPWVWLERPTVVIKHDFTPGGSWEQNNMTDNNNGTYKYIGNYGGTGANIGPSSWLKFIASPTLVGSPASGDRCIFEYNASGYQGSGNEDVNTGSLTITKLCGLTYNGNGRTGGTAVPSALSDQKYGSSVTLSSNAMTKTGYTLTGWNTANDGSGTHYDLGASFTFSDKSNTLYAEWTQTITVDKNTGTTAGSMSICFNAGSLKSFTAATKTNWVLDSYWTSSDNSGSKVIDYDASTGTASLVSSLSGYITTGKWTRTATTTLYAHWKQTYTVTYNANYPASATSTSGSVPTDATEYASGATVTVKSNSGSLAAGGYTFAGWQTEPTGGTSYVAGSGTFSISEPTTLYAKWTENKRNVTISAGTGGTVDKTSASVGVATTTTVSATAYPGYRFTGWTATNCSVASTSSASTTLSGNGTAGSGTLVANFSRTYAYLEGRMTVTNATRNTPTHIGSSEGKWDENSTRVAMDYDGTNHRFYRHTYKTPAQLSETQTDGTAQNQWFSITRSTASGSLTNPTTYHPSSNTDLTTKGIANKKAAQTSTTTANYKFNSAATDGYVILYFDEAGVWFELEHTLNYNGNGSTSGSAPAEAYYNNGTNATAAAANTFSKTNYTFGGWNTTQYITGTTYAAAASVPMTTNTMLYAKWTRSITLNQNGGGSGSTSVTATYNCATLPTITAPSKTGYTFGGWNTANDGSGDIVINTSGEFLPITGWCDSGKRFTRTASDATLYAKWTQTVVLNANTSYHGSGSNTSATIILNATAKSSITHCTPATGYHLEGYYTAASGGTKILTADGTFAGNNITVDAVAYISSGKWVKAGATTLYAQYEANTYNVTLLAGTGGSGSGTATIDYDATGYKTWSHNITQTGYHINGWYDNGEKLKVLNDDGTFAGTSVSGYITSGKWTKAANCTLQAWWDPNDYTVTLDVDEDNHGDIEDATTSHTVTYNTVTTDIPDLPTADDYYGLDGYYTDHNGEGTKVIGGDGKFIASVEGYTDADAKWIKVGGETLYAYYKQAEITDIAFSDGTVIAPSTPTTVTATVSPDPKGTTVICWRVLYSNGNPLAEQPTFTPGSGASVSFTTPEASGMYQIEAKLRKGSECGVGADDVIDTYVETFQVAGAHTVTVQYKDASGNTIKESGSVTGRPLVWSDDITAPEIFGYTFDHWNAGDGITIKNGDSDPVTTSTDKTIKIKANYDGRLTAVYNQKKYIYLDLSEQFGASKWTAPHVYFYKAAGYWDDTYGAGATGVNCVGKGAMTNIDGTDIWYYDYGSVSNFGNVIAFTKVDEMTQEHFYNTEAIYRADFSEGTPMFVPLNGQVKVTKNTNCDYYSAGYWVTYLGEKTGYNLRIKNNSTDALIKSIPFTSDTKRMTMKAVTDLEASTTYKFEIERETGKYYKNNGSRNYSNRNSNWKYTEAMSIGTIVTTATGNYTFTLGYADYNNDQNYEMRVNVEYPVTSGDYRLIYKDNVQTKFLTSANIAKKATGKDTVSFFVRPGQTPILYKQTASVANDGAVTWATTETNLITAAMLTSPITQDSVYNFNLVMDGSGNLSIGDVKAYTGNFYIRTDAANNKWDNYTNADHLMTYSEYSEKNSTYSHYFMAFVGNGTNVKFVVANDYSPCISDTLVQQGGDTYHVDASGFIGADANVRFMWKKHDNSTARAYLAAAKNDGSKFLVLRANSSTDLMDTGGNALIESANSGQAGYNHKAPDNSIQFVDNENWIYETNVKIKPGAFVKLYAFFNTKYFYYKGKDNNTFDKDNAIQLMTGSGEAELVRVIYDFKTDRLVAAWQPSGNIDEERHINADVMFVREHQGDIAQLTFSKGDGETMGAITDIKTAYGVLRFNKWTINNKSKAAGHAPLSPLLSRYERDLFYISFPFRVSMNEVFGFGTYGKHWIIEYYDGATRASKGYWAESGPNWKYVMDRRGQFFEPNQGYIIALDLDELGESSSVWDNGVENVELYFPSYGTMGDITNASVTYNIPSHLCTINRSDESNGHGGTLGPQYDRRVKDSHWNVLSVPTYVNVNNPSFANTTWITTADDTHVGPSFLYEWNPADNSVTARAGVGYTYHAMHAYLAQYCGNITWATSVTSSAAPRRNPDYRGEYNFRLELTQNDVAVDQTYVKLSDNEAVTTGFEFNYDLSKEFNKNRANIYTLIGTEQVAGNVLPLTDQTTVVPVGVSIPTAGDYTFSLPDGAEGIGVTLIDNQTGMRTRLSALDYTVNLTAGTHDGRFVLEISPIHNATTEVELINGANGANDEIGARKVLIDGILYIVKGDKLYDVRGTMIK